MVYRSKNGGSFDGFVSHNQMVYYIYIYNMSIVIFCYLILCVYHLNRCKISHWFFTNLQGVVAGSRVYHQRRRSGFPGDTWPDQPCVPANFTGMGRGSTQEPPRGPFETSIYCTVVAI